MRGVETRATLDGLTPQQAREMQRAIFGFNRVEVVEGVRRGVSRLFNADPLTAVHETIHGNWRNLLASGRYTHEHGVRWVRMAEQLTGQKFLPEGMADEAVTADVLDEALAHVGQIEVLGRRKDAVGRFTPGLVSRGLAAFIRGKRNLALGKTRDARALSRVGGDASAFKAFLDHFKAGFKLMLQAARALKRARDEGKVSEDYDEFLYDLLGADGQQQHEAAAAREAAALADESNTPFSLGPEAVRFWVRRQKPIDAPKSRLVRGGETAKKEEAERVWRSLPASVQSADGRTVQIKHNGQGTEEDLLEHLITSHRGESTWVDEWRVFGLSRILLTIQNARPRFVAKNGNHIYIQRYSDGRNHYVVVTPEGALVDQVPYDGITTQWIRLDEADTFIQVDRLELFSSPSVAEQGGISGVGSTSPRQSNPTPDPMPSEGRSVDQGGRAGAESQTPFSLAPRSLAAVADTVLASRMRKPEFREAYFTLARQKLDALRRDGDWRVSFGSRELTQVRQFGSFSD